MKRTNINRKSYVRITFIKFLLSFFLLTSCKNEKPNLIYLFPNRTKEMDQISEKLFVGKKLVFFKISSNVNSKCDFPENIYFVKDGSILDEKKQNIGKWWKNRTIYLKSCNMKFFFNYINSRKVNIVTRFIAGDSDSISIINVTYVPKINKK